MLRFLFSIYFGQKRKRNICCFKSNFWTKKGKILQKVSNQPHWRYATLLSHFKTITNYFTWDNKLEVQKKTAKISWKLWNGKTFPSWLSSFLRTAYHVKTIKYQNDHIVDAVILILHSFSWNMPHFWEKWQEVRRTLKLEGKCKSRLNSNCNLVL